MASGDLAAAVALRAVLADLAEVGRRAVDHAGEGADEGGRRLAAEPLRRRSAYISCVILRTKYAKRAASEWLHPPPPDGWRHRLGLEEHDVGPRHDAGPACRRPRQGACKGGHARGGWALVFVCAWRANRGPAVQAGGPMLSD